MSITIHHGGNGSYKSSGVIQDYIIPAATKPSEQFPRGRVVVTNLRGVSRERCVKVLGEDKVLDGFDVVHVDTATMVGREKLLRFFHWAPQGALLVFDECNVMFPKSLKDADLQQLNYKTLEEAEAENRPHVWLQAWEMHRHYNWDIVLMCPSIKAVRSDIKDTTEGAYKHVNMSLIGVPGRYKEGFHEAENNGTRSNILNATIKRIRKQTFELYDSSKTGKVSDTLNGFSLFQSPRLLLALGILAVAGFNFFRNGGAGFFEGDFIQGNAPIDEGDVEGAQVVAAEAGAAVPEVRVVPTGHVADSPSRSFDLVGPLQGFSLRISSVVKVGAKVLYNVQGYQQGFEPLSLDLEELQSYGYAVRPLGRCAVQVSWSGQDYVATCAPLVQRQSERDGWLGGGASFRATSPASQTTAGDLPR